MELSLSRHLIFQAAIAILFLVLTATSSPVSALPLQQLAKAILPRNGISDYGNSTDPVLSLEPKPIN
jgi:hypothetical protein